VAAQHLVELRTHSEAYPAVETITNVINIDALKILLKGQSERISQQCHDKSVPARMEAVCAAL